jgi:hypothetical protein
MKVYLDAKDLINILQVGVPCTANQLTRHLIEHDHQLAVSYDSIVEISAPLLSPSSQTKVMRLLNDLARMPIAYLHADIRGLELREALDAFSLGREYHNILPFVKRFDETFDLSAEPASRRFMNYSLPEIVWDLYAQNGLHGLGQYSKLMKKYVAADRGVKALPSLKGHFAKVIERNLRDDGLSYPGMSIKEFSNWVYDTPSRCPSIRLSYEVWYQIVKNKSDRLEDSDMEDYQHLICLPYVDFMTLDRRMHRYVSQAAVRSGMQCADKSFKSVEEVLKRIGFEA